MRPSPTYEAVSDLRGRLRPTRPSPTYEAVSDLQGRLRPAKGRLRPAKGRLRPAKGRLRPAKGRLRPAKGRLRPAKGRLRPAKGRLRPGLFYFVDPVIILSLLIIFRFIINKHVYYILLKYILLCKQLLRIVQNEDLQLHEQSNACLHGLI